MSVVIGERKITTIGSAQTDKKLIDLFNRIFHPSNVEKIMIKFTCNFMSDSDISRLWKKLSCDGKWNNLEMHEGETGKIDYLIIVNSPHIPLVELMKRWNLSLKKIIVFSMEPDCETGPRWNTWFLPFKKHDFLRYHNHSRYFNNNEWHLSLDYQTLSNVVTTTRKKGMSSIVSSLYQMDGHKRRIQFLKYLETKWDSVLGDLDIFGRENAHRFVNYRGSLPSHEKNIGIINYKYTFIAENCSMKNYYTEKLIDAVLGETLCFYWGCPNIDDFIDPRAYITLGLNNFEDDAKLVFNSILGGEYEKRLNVIRNEKKKILDHYSVFPRVEGVIMTDKMEIVYHEHDDKKTDRKEIERMLYDNQISWKSVIFGEIPINRADFIYLNSCKFPEHFLDKIAIGYRELCKKNGKVLILKYSLEPRIRCQIYPIVVENYSKTCRLERINGSGVYSLDV